MSQEPTTKKRVRRPVPVEIESDSARQVSLELDLGTQENPVGFVLKAPQMNFRDELTNLLLEIPALIEQLTPENELPVGQEPVKFVAANYQATVSDAVIVVATSMGDVVISLPTATNMGKRLVIVKETSDASTVTISAFGNDTIESSSSKTLSTQWAKALLESDGVSNWFDLGTGLV